MECSLYIECQLELKLIIKTIQNQIKISSHTSNNNDDDDGNPTQFRSVRSIFKGSNKNNTISNNNMRGGKFCALKFYQQLKCS